MIQVGENLDTYWDHFRDYLRTGSVPIQETYILRAGAASVGRLVRELVTADGELSVQSAASRLRTSDRGVYNLARELRQLGIANVSKGEIRIDPSIHDAHDFERAMRDRIAATLRRHAAYAALADDAEANGGTI